MATIHKISGYVIDPYSKATDNDIEESINHVTEGWMKHFHCESAPVTDLYLNDDILTFYNCDLSECEKYFHNKPSTESGRPVPQTGELYRHFKAGKIVEVICVAQSTEHIGSYEVIYRNPLDKSKMAWRRPLDMFLSKTDKTKYPTATQEWRFEKVDFDEAFPENAAP